MRPAVSQSYLQCVWRSLFFFFFSFLSFFFYCAWETLERLRWEASSLSRSKIIKRKTNNISIGIHRRMRHMWKNTFQDAVSMPVRGLGSICHRKRCFQRNVGAMTVFPCCLHNCLLGKEPFSTTINHTAFWNVDFWRLFVQEGCQRSGGLVKKYRFSIFSLKSTVDWMRCLRCRPCGRRSHHRNRYDRERISALLVDQVPITAIGTFNPEVIHGLTSTLCGKAPAQLTINVRPTDKKRREIALDAQQAQTMPPLNGLTVDDRPFDLPLRTKPHSQAHDNSLRKSQMLITAPMRKDDHHRTHIVPLVGLVAG